MILYLLYRIGHCLSMLLPLWVTYGMACIFADIFYHISSKDRIAVINNIKVISGGSISEKDAANRANEVFRNFARYLVDFFRASKIDDAYIKKYAKVEGLENIDKALSKGKGAIMLSAHIGNWELGGMVLSMVGYPLSAVVLTHQNKKINDFFRRQRMKGKVNPIEVGFSLKAGYRVLKNNGLLALLGDRDFSKNGSYSEVFGKRMLMPRGPYLLSARIGSAIVPSFMLREPGDTFRLVFEEPIFPDTNEKEDVIVKTLMNKYIKVLEPYVKRYPSQWYIFKELGTKNGEEDMRPDTII